MLGTGRTIFGTALCLMASVEPLAAHTVESGGPVHDILHLVWGQNHTIPVRGLILLVAAIGVGLALRATGRRSKV
jgi:hypothetical protein